MAVLTLLLLARRLLVGAVLVVGLGACASNADAPTSARPTTTTARPTTTTVLATTTTEPAPSTTTTTAVLRHIFPIDPPSVTSYSPGHHDYPATDIFCPQGSHFVAVTDGTVDYVSTVDTWDPNVDDPATRGGLSVAIVGDDGIRYYGSHLSAIAPGIHPGLRVHAGDLLGLTGKTGNAANVDPHLHFGISHPTTPDDWEVRRGEVDTYPILQAWQRGENLTPTVPGVPG
jgi:murein DD-endopeptidase MepM/ murein hydrolase activator NlpD